MDVQYRLGMTTAQIKEFLELGREFGLKSLAIGGLEVEFGPPPAPAGQHPVPIGAGEPTEDELLFASAPGGAPDFKDGKPVFTERLPFGGVAPLGTGEEPA